MIGSLLVSLWSHPKTKVPSPHMQGAIQKKSVQPKIKTNPKSRYPKTEKATKSIPKPGTIKQDPARDPPPAMFIWGARTRHSSSRHIQRQAMADGLRLAVEHARPRYSSSTPTSQT